MNKLTGEHLIDLADLKRQIAARDREIETPYTKDVQVMDIRNALGHGEVAGFGGGGVHGHRSLEGAFLCLCLCSGRQAGRAAAEATAT